MYVIVKSQKDKRKALRKHILKDVVPRGFDAKIEDLTSRVEAFEFMNETHQQTIEEKDAAIELLNDDQKNCEYENVALQAQRDVYQAELQNCQDTITHLKTRYVPHARNPGKTTLSSLYGNIQHLSTINIMNCHIISREYNDAKGMLN